jgi:hypothetical protein
MASRDEYQQYNFSQELINIDIAVDNMDQQLAVVLKEVEKLAVMGNNLKQHHVAYKNIWKQHNVHKLTEILKKSKDLDNIVYNNF